MLVAADDAGPDEIGGHGVDVGERPVVRGTDDDLERLVLVPGGLDRGSPQPSPEDRSAGLA